MSVVESLSHLLGADADPVAAGYHLRQLAEGPPDTGIVLLAQLAAADSILEQSDPAILGAILRVMHNSIAKSIQDQPQQTIEKLDHTVIRSVAERLPEAATNRHLLLHLLAIMRSAESLKALVAILIQRPPQDWMNAGLVLSPLMQRNDWPIEAFFPECLACLPHPSLAASLLDLANYLTRSGRVDGHLAADHLETLNHLLGSVATRLGHFEENPRTLGNDVEEVQKRLSEAVALAVSLCDAVALIGDESSIGKLNQAVGLRHRRVQCEAAGALAKLGDEEGRKRLIELAGDPAARLRAIAYADELGWGDEIDESNRSDAATAEAELALWLTQPHQMGVPPTHVEFIETRRLMWPSFNDPVDVHLVRFEYSMGANVYSNIGMTGPSVYTMSCDLADMPVDDIYAIYAGWQAEHPDIFTVAADSLNEAQHRVMDVFGQHLQHLGYESIRPELLGLFLDERAGVFRGEREGTQCIIVTDGLETIDQPTAGRLRPLTASDAFHLYKGRKMLRTFNS
ncbi:HEAT repeat domain-containing protein [Stieleria varia]|uniref:HEAT repeat domain-containing protein n=1 Tax=Stieleria varia TaxID=2528005 RepID=UPI0011B76175|nr:HEAT repeat domain-containing protein [Stieleria varia]